MGPVVCITKMKYLLCILGLVFIVRQSLGIEQTTALRRALLAGYEKDAKPDGKVETKVGLRVTTMDLCAHRQALTSTVWLEMMWTYRRLVWDPQEFGGMDTIRINAKNLWIPDITTYNAMSEMKPMMNGVEELSTCGHVLWIGHFCASHEIQDPLCRQLPGMALG